MKIPAPLLPRGGAFTGALILSLLASSSPLFAIQEGPVLLRLSGDKGDAATLRNTQEMTMDLPPEMGIGEKMTTRMSIVLDQTATGTRGDTIVYHTTISDVQLTIDPAPPGMPVPDLAVLKGREFDYSLTTRGAVAGLQVEHPEGSEDISQYVPQIQNWLNQFGFPSLPEGKVSVGDTWTDTLQVPVASMLRLGGDGTAPTIRTTTLKGLSRVGDATVADLTIEGSVEFHSPEEAEGPAIDMQGSSAASVRFDVTNGHFLGSTGAMDFTMNMSIPGAPMDFSFTGAGKTKTEVSR